MGREGSNLRMAESKSAALPLGDAPASRVPGRRCPPGESMGPPYSDFTCGPQLTAIWQLNRRSRRQCGGLPAAAVSQLSPVAAAGRMVGADGTAPAPSAENPLAASHSRLAIRLPSARLQRPSIRRWADRVQRDNFDWRARPCRTGRVRVVRFGSRTRSARTCSAPSSSARSAGRSCQCHSLFA